MYKGYYAWDNLRRIWILWVNDIQFNTQVDYKELGNRKQVNNYIKNVNPIVDWQRSYI